MERSVGLSGNASKSSSLLQALWYNLMYAQDLIEGNDFTGALFELAKFNPLKEVPWPRNEDHLYVVPATNLLQCQ